MQRIIKDKEHQKLSRAASKKTRSEIMSAIRDKNTLPELKVRSALYSAGFRFRIHDNRLPGTPDIVLKKWKCIIFVHGCFWHQHPGCKRSKRPASNTDFWNDKLDKNIARDKQNQCKLETLGWKVLVLWECQLKERNWLDGIITLIATQPALTLPDSQNPHQS
ncbi:very short patch repair endonuclease [Pseudomonas sp. BN515]|uniref:very short patch repair endonuclease n=1 Tax=Pseudomonas sp. BN515 TaxID=2567892 RepID=UPI00245634FC|nr:very short patch repair endonuclease [Pseudomonas sp. BN515]MDH4870587.1 DNA mismatch endonuclease Vsr [Pseudomonas sp. BN515]